MRSPIKFASATVVITVALLVAAPVAAASPPLVFREAGTSAFAFNGECVDNPNGTVTCENQSIDVFKGTTKQVGEPTIRGQRVCYSESTDTFDATTGQPIQSHAVFGCNLEGRTVRINGLTSLTLAPTVIELSQFDCTGFECTEPTAAGTTTVYGTWTAEGPVIKQTGKFTFDDGTCRQVQSDKSRSRAATFDGSIVAAEARLGIGSFTFRSDCPL